VKDFSGKAPSARAGHCGEIYKTNLYIFGGWNGSRRLNDLHCYEIGALDNPARRTWCAIEANGNIPSSRAGMSLCKYKSKYLVVFGGCERSSSYLNDLHFFDIS
jgi:N-acetylneuraminic acid mutarotase